MFSIATRFHNGCQWVKRNFPKDGRRGASKWIGKGDCVRWRRANGKVRRRRRRRVCWAGLSGSIPHSAFSLYQRKAPVCHLFFFPPPPLLRLDVSNPDPDRMDVRWKKSPTCRPEEGKRRKRRRRREEKQMTKRRKIKLHEHNVPVVPVEIYTTYTYISIYLYICMYKSLRLFIYIYIYIYCMYNEMPSISETLWRLLERVSTQLEPVIHFPRPFFSI